MGNTRTYAISRIDPVEKIKLAEHQRGFMDGYYDKPLNEEDFENEIYFNGYKNGTNERYHHGQA